MFVEIGMYQSSDFSQFLRCNLLLISKVSEMSITKRANAAADKYPPQDRRRAPLPPSLKSSKSSVPPLQKGNRDENRYQNVKVSTFDKDETARDIT